MNKLWEFIKRWSKRYLYSLTGILLAIIFMILLSYSQFYVHELGHANAALLTTQIEHIPSVTINFTYQPLILFGYDTGLKYPQQTWATVLPPLMSSYGVLFSIMFYLIIFLLIGRLKIVRNNKYLEYLLLISLLILIVRDISFNLFCGTDGFKLSCNSFILGGLSIFFGIALLLSLGAFFVMTIYIIKNGSLQKY
jgi:hypothetical protein